MGCRRWVWVLVLVAAGCHHPAPAPVPPRPAAPTATLVTAELPEVKPTTPGLEPNGLPKPSVRAVGGPEGNPFRKLTERDCLLRAAANTSAANLLDDENRVPPGSAECKSSDELRRTMRYHTALEFRNRSAADALERYFQLADVEARTNLLRTAFPVIDDLLAKARKAKAADVRFPLEVADLERDRSQLVSQLEQAEHGSRLLNLDLKRRLGLPAVPTDERLWPSGDFAIDTTPVDAALAVNAALADRPELRGLRALHAGLTPDTLPDVRDLLRAGSPLLGAQRVPLPARGLLRMLSRKPAPDPALAAELEVRRKQLADLIAERERGVADEARAAALGVNAQTTRVLLARDRLRMCEEKLADAVKKREANQPGAEFTEPQLRAEWLKARAEVVAEAASWHQTRVRLKAAQGWLAWEAAPGK